MKKVNLILILLIPLIFIGCDDDNKKEKDSVTDDIQLEVTLERNMTSSHPLDIIFKLTNLSEETVYYDSKSVPYNGQATLDIFNITEDGTPIKYNQHTAIFYYTNFDSLAPGETYNTSVSFDRAYLVTKSSHHYKISYKDTIAAKISDKKAEFLDDPKMSDISIKPNELAPKDHTSKIIQVKSNTLEFEATINEIREP